MATNTTPRAVDVMALCSPVSDYNIAGVINRPGEEAAPAAVTFTHTTDDGLASRRSLHTVRTHAELAASKLGELPLGIGLSLRQRMAGAAENNQFPYRTDLFGKQRD